LARQKKLRARYTGLLQGLVKTQQRRIGFHSLAPSSSKRKSFLAVKRKILVTVPGRMSLSHRQRRLAFERSLRYLDGRLAAKRANWSLAPEHFWGVQDCLAVDTYPNLNYTSTSSDSRKSPKKENLSNDFVVPPLAAFQRASLLPRQNTLALLDGVQRSLRHSLRWVWRFQADYFGQLFPGSQQTVGNLSVLAPNFFELEHKDYGDITELAFPYLIDAQDLVVQEDFLVYVNAEEQALRSFRSALRVAGSVPAQAELAVGRLMAFQARLHPLKEIYDQYFRLRILHRQRWLLRRPVTGLAGTPAGLQGGGFHLPK